MPASDIPPEDAAGALRLFVGGWLPLASGLVAELPEAAVRHAQVRRVQPGDLLRLFDGHGCDWPARVLEVGRKNVRVRLGEPETVALELPLQVTLALVVPANERMDSLVEKATELGVARIQPLMSDRSVLRLSGERALRRQVHWQAVAVAACEQCGRARVPEVAPVLALLPWLRAEAGPTPANASAGGTAAHWLLSLHAQARPLAGQYTGALRSVVTLSGPEGGLSADEEQAALAAGFVAVSLGPRVLRADTAPLALLAWLGLQPR
jgi:16S rRNA (uracil1498-N3)-methyltransferase